MKIKVENLKCFDEVAKVIGVANAKRELFIALSSIESELDDEVNIDSVFTWSETHQGHYFWSKIASGVNPYAN